MSSTLDRLVSETPRSPNPRTKRLKMIQQQKESEDWSRRLEDQNLLLHRSKSYIYRRTRLTPLDYSDNCVFPAFQGKARKQVVSPYIDLQNREPIPTKSEVREVMRHLNKRAAPDGVPKFQTPTKNVRRVKTLTPTSLTSSIAKGMEGAGFM